MIVSNSGMRKGAQTLTWLALIQLFPVLTLVENWLVMAGVLPYPISPEAVSFQNCYIVIESILFLLLIAVLLIRYVRFPKDWVSWYATGSLLIFGLFQLTVFAAFGAKTLFDSSSAWLGSRLFDSHTQKVELRELSRPNRKVPVG